MYWINFNFVSIKRNKSQKYGDACQNVVGKKKKLFEKKNQKQLTNRHLFYLLKQEWH